MKRKEFEKYLDIGWDYAINKISKDEGISSDVYLLCDMYCNAYLSVDYVNDEDSCDDGLCFRIRQFCIENIFDMLEK